MDRRILLDHFCYITSLASFAYTFTMLHSIQYSMRDHNHENNNSNAETLQDNDSKNCSTSAHAHVSPTTDTTSISETIKKSSGQWTDSEVKLLLDYVERNCTLTTTQVINLMKSDFNKAHTLVKLKDANQCRYKWRDRKSVV